MYENSVGMEYEVDRKSLWQPNNTTAHSTCPKQRTV